MIYLSLIKSRSKQTGNTRTAQLSDTFSLLLCHPQHGALLHGPKCLSELQPLHVHLASRKRKGKSGTCFLPLRTLLMMFLLNSHWLEHRDTPRCKGGWETFFFFLLRSLCAQCGAQTHEPEIKTHILYQLNQSGTPGQHSLLQVAMYLLKIKRINKDHNLSPGQMLNLLSHPGTLRRIDIGDD